MAADPVARALSALGAAHEAIRQAIDALHQTPAGRKYTEAKQPNLPPAAAAKRAKVPPVSSSSRPLPTPTTPAPRPKPTLNPATRAENLVAVTKIAKNIVAVVGPDSPLLRDAVCGQVALNKIAADDQLIADAIEAAMHA